MLKRTDIGAVAVRAEQLTKTYKGGRRGDVTALSGLDLEVETGTVFALLGPNGAGKSTTVKILSTLSRKDGGRASVAGVDIDRDPAEVRRRIGVVAQASGVDIEATALENLMLQGRFHGLGGPGLKRRALELLGQFGLGEAAGRIARGFSGGMKRRLDIAMSLMHRPALLFLDEPTTGLDPEIRTEMWAEIQRLSVEEGLTILLTTHYLEEADRLAARVAIVDQGRVVAEGGPAELKAGLEGDAIEAVLADPPDAALADRLAALPGLTGVVLEGTRLHARSTDAAAALPGLLTAVAEAGSAMASISLTRPTLDDVYLKHTGHSLAAAEEEKEAGR